MRLQGGGAAAGGDDDAADTAVGGGAVALDGEGSEGDGPSGAASDFDGVLQFKFHNE